MHQDNYVYNLEVEDNHNYFVNGILVHNCQKAPSRTFSEAVTAFDSKYLMGLSATPWRRDKLTQLIFWYLGNIIHQVDATQLIDL